MGRTPFSLPTLPETLHGRVPFTFWRHFLHSVSATLHGRGTLVTYRTRTGGKRFGCSFPRHNLSTFDDALASHEPRTLPEAVRSKEVTRHSLLVGGYGGTTVPSTMLFIDKFGPSIKHSTWQKKLFDALAFFLVLLALVANGLCKCPPRPLFSRGPRDQATAVCSLPSSMSLCEMMRRATSAALSLSGLEHQEGERDADFHIPTLTWPPEPSDSTASSSAPGNCRNTKNIGERAWPGRVDDATRVLAPWGLLLGECGVGVRITQEAGGGVISAPCPSTRVCGGRCYSAFPRESSQSPSKVVLPDGNPEGVEEMFGVRGQKQLMSRRH